MDSFRRIPHHTSLGNCSTMMAVCPTTRVPPSFLCCLLVSSSFCSVSLHHFSRIPHFQLIEPLSLENHSLLSSLVALLELLSNFLCAKVLFDAEDFCESNKGQTCTYGRQSEGSRFSLLCHVEAGFRQPQ